MRARSTQRSTEILEATHAVSINRNKKKKREKKKNTQKQRDLLCFLSFNHLNPTYMHNTQYNTLFFNVQSVFSPYVIELEKSYLIFEPGKYDMDNDSQF